MRRQQTPFRFTGWHLFACMAAFFGVVIAVNVTMAMLASGSWTGLIVKNSYVASQHFNEALEEAKAQKARGWTSRLAYEEGEIRFTLQSGEGDTLLLAEAEVSVGRPAYEQVDETLVLIPRGEGVYAAPANLAPGVWSLTVHASHDGKGYRRDARLYIDTDGRSRIE